MHDMTSTFRLLGEGRPNWRLPKQLEQNTEKLGRVSFVGAMRVWLRKSMWLLVLVLVSLVLIKDGECKTSLAFTIVAGCVGCSV